MAVRLFSCKQTPTPNILLNFQCDVSDSWSICHPLNSLAEFFPENLVLMQFMYVPVFLLWLILQFHILCHCKEGLLFIKVFKLISISNSVLQHISSISQHGTTCKFDTLLLMRSWASMLLRISSILIGT